MTGAALNNSDAAGCVAARHLSTDSAVGAFVLTSSEAQPPMGSQDLLSQVWSRLKCERPEIRCGVSFCSLFKDTGTYI